MAFSGSIGARIDMKDMIYLDEDKRFDFSLFSESNTRFLIEVEKEHSNEIAEIFNGLPCAKIGETMDAKQLQIFFKEKKLVDLPLAIIASKWRRKII
jgi:phosphoribosylformylglycinamidine (FGAM) synthase-like enzyme